MNRPNLEYVYIDILVDNNYISQVIAYALHRLSNNLRYPLQYNIINKMENTTMMSSLFIYRWKWKVLSHLEQLFHVEDEWSLGMKVSFGRIPLGQIRSFLEWSIIEEFLDHVDVTQEHSTATISETDETSNANTYLYRLTHPTGWRLINDFIQSANRYNRNDFLPQTPVCLLQ